MYWAMKQDRIVTDLEGNVRLVPAGAVFEAEGREGDMIQVKVGEATLHIPKEYLVELKGNPELMVYLATQSQSKH